MQRNMVSRNREMLGELNVCVWKLGHFARGHLSPASSNNSQPLQFVSRRGKECLFIPSFLPSFPFPGSCMVDLVAARGSAQQWHTDLLTGQCVATAVSASAPWVHVKKEKLFDGV